MLPRRLDSARWPQVPQSEAPAAPMPRGTERMVASGRIGFAHGVRWFSADFNCTVKEPAYVNAIMDKLSSAMNRRSTPARSTSSNPFPLRPRSQSNRRAQRFRPQTVFLDESAHDWEFVRLGRRLAGAAWHSKPAKPDWCPLSLCWAKAHGMPSWCRTSLIRCSPMILHAVRPLAPAGTTIQGVECNAMQFYPDASIPEEAIHPGLYRRRDGVVD